MPLPSVLSLPFNLDDIHDSTSHSLIFLGLSGVVCISALYFKLSRSRLPLPPGPKSSWFSGPPLPSPYPWVSYSRWAETYGDIMYYSALGNPVLILNSYEAMTDLLDKRGDIYSSRPYRTMVLDVIGFDYLFTSMQYGNRWKRHRNLFHKYFKRIDREVYNSVQVKQTHAFLRTLLHDPTNFRSYVRRTAAAVVLDLIYGHDVAEQGDGYVELADDAIRSMGRAGLFGTYLVDYIPWLKYVPAWFPFAEFQRQAKEWRKPVRELVEKPFNSVKEKMLAGGSMPCLVADELESLWSGSSTVNEDIIKNAAATGFGAGADTVVSTVLSYFLAMAHNPEGQKRAQEELDRVLGSRLPTLSDRADLPLIDSICWELLRWNPVTPLALSHYAAETNEYRGYRIPKGTAVIPNVWAVLHDAQRYPDPFTFKADRFLDQGKNSREGINPIPEIVFGFGRRICAGRYLALDFIFLAVSSLASVYNVTKAVDEQGNVIEPVVEYSPYFLSHPNPFQCDIRPRSPQAVVLIQQTMRD